MAEVPNSAGIPGYAIKIERGVFPSPEGEVIAQIARFNTPAMSIERIVECCGDLASLSRATRERELSGDGLDAAVYVITGKRRLASKIGVTRRPLHRLETLQNGSFEPLAFTHIFWMDSRAAYGIEGLALRCAAKLGKRLSGEWIDAPPTEAASIVAAVLSGSSVSFSDSKMFCQNFRNAYPKHSSGLLLRTLADREGALLDRIDKGG